MGQAVQLASSFVVFHGKPETGTEHCEHPARGGLQ
jgi:hypothetical protein